MKITPRITAKILQTPLISRLSLPGTRKRSRKAPAKTPTHSPLLCCLAVFFLTLLAGIGFLAMASPASAAETMTNPMFQLSLAGGIKEPEQVSLGLEILFLLTILSLAPAIILTVTSFTQIIIVFHFIRQALGV